MNARELDSELHYSSAAALASAIRNKQVSSEQVVTAFLARIEAVNPSLNAVFQVDAERALAAARDADSRLARGQPVGALHGVPMTIKDSLDTAGMISTGGTKGRARYVPGKDATVVARLRAAGAILLGKTNTPEFTMSFETSNAVYGRTNNPYDPERTPGGSSGGASAIVAAGGSAFDVGSDYGGSIRMPAHATGIAGIKPTSGRVPRTGHVFPFGGLLDAFQQLGPMARYVEDLRLLLPVLAGPDGIDPYIVPMPLPDPTEVNVRDLRVCYHTDNGILAPDPEIAESVSAAASVLAGTGCSVAEARPPGIEQSYQITMDLWNRCDAPLLKALLEQAGTAPEESTLDWLFELPPASDVDIVDAVTRADACRARMLSVFEDYDVIVCPANAHPALRHAQEDAADLRPFSYTSTYNLTGWPAAVVRGGTSPDGLPIGIQIVARPWREDIALAVAALLEDELGGFEAPPI
jgi:amidase